MRIGSEDMLKSFNRLEWAERSILGLVDDWQQQFLGDLVDSTIMASAEARVRLGLSKFIQEAQKKKR